MSTKWRVVLAVVVAFAVGAGAGAYGEHVRLKHSSNKKATTTQTVPGAPLNVFGAKAKQACPAVKQWHDAAVATYKAIFTKAAWSATSAELVKQSAASVKAYQAMMPFATPVGKVAIRALVNQATRHQTAAKTAKSYADYAKATTAQPSPLAKRATTVLTRAATTTCAAA